MHESFQHSRRRLVLGLIGLMACAQFMSGFFLLMQQDPHEIGVPQAVQISVGSTAQTQTQPPPNAGRKS